jgi:hypothetical protein
MLCKSVCAQYLLWLEGDYLQNGCNNPTWWRLTSCDYLFLRGSSHMGAHHMRVPCWMKVTPSQLPVGTLNYKSCNLPLDLKSHFWNICWNHIFQVEIWWKFASKINTGVRLPILCSVLVPTPLHIGSVQPVMHYEKKAPCIQEDPS